MLAFEMLTSCCELLILPVMTVTWFRKRKCLKWQWPQRTPSLPSFLSFFRKGACEAAAVWGDISTPSVEEMNEEEALGSSYTANNVTGRTVWTMGLWGIELRWDHSDWTHSAGRWQVNRPGGVREGHIYSSWLDVGIWLRINQYC